MKIFVKAKPSSKHESVKKFSETNFEICVKESPVKGQANTVIILGHTSRQKIIEID